MRFPRVVFSGSCFTPSMHSNPLATFPGGGRIGTGFSVVRNASRGSSWREVVATDRRAVEEPPGKPVRQIGSSPVATAKASLSRRAPVGQRRATV